MRCNLFSKITFNELLINFTMDKNVRPPLWVNPFVPNAPFLYPLKKSENLTVFWCFQGVEKECIRNKWVKCRVFIFNPFLANLPSHLIYPENLWFSGWNKETKGHKPNEKGQKSTCQLNYIFHVLYFRSVIKMMKTENQLPEWIKHPAIYICKTNISVFLKFLLLFIL